MRADIQRYYGLDIDDEGHTASHIADCAANLPLGSCLLARINPMCSYTYTDFELHRLADALAGEHIPFPWERKNEMLPELDEVSKEEFDEWYSQEFKEVRESGKRW